MNDPDQNEIVISNHSKSRISNRNQSRFLSQKPTHSPLESQRLQTDAFSERNEPFAKSSQHNQPQLTSAFPNEEAKLLDANNDISSYKRDLKEESKLSDQDSPDWSSPEEKPKPKFALKLKAIVNTKIAASKFLASIDHSKEGGAQSSNQLNHQEIKLELKNGIAGEGLNSSKNQGENKDENGDPSGQKLSLKGMIKSISAKQEEESPNNHAKVEIDDDSPAKQGMSSKFQAALELGVKAELQEQIDEDELDKLQDQKKDNLKDSNKEGQKKKKKREKVDLPDDQEETDALIDSRNQQQEGTIFSLIFSVCFIVYFLMEVNISQGTSVSAMIAEQLIDCQFNLTNNMTMNTMTGLSYMPMAMTFLLQSLYTNTPYTSEMYTVNDDDSTLRRMLATNTTTTNTSNSSKNSSNTSNSSSNKSNSTMNTSVANSSALYITMMSKYNYYAGMRMYTQNAAINKNMSEAYFDMVLPKYREGYYSGAEDGFASQNTTNFGNFTYNTEKQAFTQFFKGNQSLNAAQSIFRNMLNASWFSQNMIETKFEIMFYNQNAEIGIIIYLTYFINNAGSFIVDEYERVFLPQNYYEITTYVIIRLVFFAIFVLGILILSLQTIWTLIKNIKNLFLGQGWGVAWYTYVDMIVAALGIITIYYWFRLFFRKTLTSDFTLPIEKESTFQQYIDYSDLLKQFTRISAGLVIIMCVRNLRVLTTQFPSFGVLFDTIRYAQQDLIFFFIFVLIFMFASCVGCIILFGFSAQGFCNMANAAMTLFQAIFGHIDYTAIENANQSMAPVFFFPYIILFYFIILNMFAAIVMRTYDNLRQRKQLVTAAMAMIVSRKAQEAKTIWINFLCCRIRSPTAKKAVSDDDDSESEEEQADDLDDMLVGLGEDKSNQQVEKPSFKAKILYNIFQIKHIINGDQNMQTREEFEKEIHKYKIKIVRQKKIDQQRKLDKFKGGEGEESYKQLKSMIAYIFFIINSVTMLTRQMNNEVNHHQFTPIINQLMSDEFHQITKFYNIFQGEEISSIPNTTFLAIKTQDDMFDFITFELFPFIYDEKSNFKKFNYPISNQTLRFTFRFINQSLSNNSQTSTVFTTKSNAYTIEAATGLQYGETTHNFTTEKYSIGMNYSKPGNKFTTFKGDGGYEIYLYNNITVAWDTMRNSIYLEDWMSYGLGSLTIDFVTFNPNYQQFMYSCVEFEIDGSGRVYPRMELHILLINHFVSSNKGLIFNELIYLLFVIYFDVLQIQLMVKIWIKMSPKPVQDFSQAKPHICKRIFMVLGIDFNRMKDSNFIIIILKVFLGLIIFLLRTILKCFRVLWTYNMTSIYQFLDFLSIITSFALIYIYIQILVYPGFTIDENGNILNVIQDANGLAQLFQLYRTISCLNIVLTFLRILQFFTFSKKLSFLVDILSSAKSDIIFFAMMFMIVTFGYAIGGYALFGGSVYGFSSLVLSFITLFKMLKADFDYSSMYNADSLLAGIYFVSFEVMFTLGLLNMFIAIIAAHYNEFTRESKGEEATSFFTMIHAILKGNLFKRPPGSKSIIPKWDMLQDYLDDFFFKEKTEEKEKTDEYHAKEAKQMKAILSERVNKPSMKDYQIHQGMKPYFADIQDMLKKQNLHDGNEHEKNEQNIIMKGKLLGNVGIFKRLEEQHEHQSNNIKYELNNVNYWLYQLEESVQKITNKKLSVFDLQNDNNCFHALHEDLNTDKLTRFQKQFLLYEKNDFEGRVAYVKQYAPQAIQKFDIWKALDFEKDLCVLSEYQKEYGFGLLKFIQGMQSEAELKENQIENVQFKSLISSPMFKRKFNRVSKFQHYLWTQVFNHEEKYFLWFEYFDTLDRVKLWNRLVFSENYFNFVANTDKYKRKDIRIIMQRIESKKNADIKKRRIQIKNELIQQKKQEQEDNLLDVVGAPKIKVTLDEWEERKIRDLYYNNKVMLFLWNQLKKRQFEVPVKNKNKKDPNAPQNITLTLGKKDYIEMLRDMFKLMIGGLQGERVKNIHKMQEKGGAISKLKVYHKLAEEEFDTKEYRLSLWLPLSIEEKLDMILNQRIEEEMEMMVFLVEEELDVTKVTKNNELLEVLLEKAFDAQIFEKYMACTRLQATKKSLDLCTDRVDEIHKEDKSLIEYASFLHLKLKEYDTLIQLQKMEYDVRLKENTHQSEKIKKKEEEQKARQHIRDAHNNRRSTFKNSKQKKQPGQSSMSMANVEEHPEEDESHGESQNTDRDGSISPKTYNSRKTYAGIKKDKKFMGFMKEGIKQRMSVLSSPSKGSNSRRGSVRKRAKQQQIVSEEEEDAEEENSLLASGEDDQNNSKNFSNLGFSRIEESKNHDGERSPSRKRHNLKLGNMDSSD